MSSRMIHHWIVKRRWGRWTCACGASGFDVKGAVAGHGPVPTSPPPPKPRPAPSTKRLAVPVTITDEMRVDLARHMAAREWCCHPEEVTDARLFASGFPEMADVAIDYLTAAFREAGKDKT